MNIPALPPLANVAVENQYHHIHAPDIAVNAIVSVNDLAAAFFEALIRFVLFPFYFGATLEDVMESFVRCSAVVNAYADQVYQRDTNQNLNIIINLMIGFGNDMNLLRADINQLRADTNQLRADTNQLCADTNQLRADTNQLRWRFENQEIKIGNGKRMNFPIGHNPFILPLLKVVEGFGPGLPGYQVNVPANAPYAAGSVVPAELFPTFDQLTTLSFQDLSLYSAVYNDDFGIIATDNIQTSIDKFKNYISF